jgi:hypothetical protein
VREMPSSFARRFSFFARSLSIIMCMRVPELRSAFGFASGIAHQCNVTPRNAQIGAYYLAFASFAFSSSIFL